MDSDGRDGMDSDGRDGMDSDGRGRRRRLFAISERRGPT
jgi:hypothetical protein